MPRPSFLGQPREGQEAYVNTTATDHKVTMADIFNGLNRLSVQLDGVRDGPLSLDMRKTLNTLSANLLRWKQEA